MYVQNVKETLSKVYDQLANGALYILLNLKVCT